LCWIYQNFIFSIFYISQVSVVIYLMLVGKDDNDFIALLYPKVKEFLKSANIWQSYGRIISLVFFDSVYMYVKLILLLLQLQILYYSTNSWWLQIRYIYLQHYMTIITAITLQTPEKNLHNL